MVKLSTYLILTICYNCSTIHSFVYSSLKKYKSTSKCMNHKNLDISRLNILQSSYFDFDFDDGSNYEEEKEITPQSQFGTRQYWDDTYIGRGDFPMEEYSWYYGWDDRIKKMWMNEVIPNIIKLDDVSDVKQSSILIPGIGNDSIILDLYNAGWKYLTAFDYSQYAIDRQYDLLYTSNVKKGLDNGNVQLYVMDATDLNEDKVIQNKEEILWTEQFDIIFEKGALDAIYLSSSEGDERIPVQMSVMELTRVLKKGGLFVSVSGVVPEQLRRQLFALDKWEWICDGSDDLQAGFFVWKKI